MAFSESDAEHSAEVSIASSGLSESLNEGVPLLNEGAKLVSGDIQSIEVSVAIEVLDLLNLQSHLSPGVLLLLTWITVKIGVGYLENATSQAISSDFYHNEVKLDAPIKQKWNHLLCPAVLLQGVRVGVETSNVDGTCTLYHSFLTNGWALKTDHALAINRYDKPNL